MSSSIRVDLSNLPFPNVIQPLDFEAELASLKAELLSKDPTLADALNLESEPLVKLLEVFAYRLVNKTNQSNQTAKALMLAYALDADLDHLGANRDVYRLTIKAADPLATPPTDAILESNEAFRRRIQLAPERDAAGSVGSYLYWALSADGDIRDASVIVSEAGHVQIWIQSHSAAIAPQPLLDLVNAALDPQTRRPATDYLTVHAATPADWTLNAELTLFAGPDKSVVIAAAQAQLDIYIDRVSYLGYDVVLSGLYAALHCGGVQRVNLITPTTPLILDGSQYARCTSNTISSVEYRDV